MSSPTQRTLAHLRKLGYLAAVTEHWNPHARIRQDLFGVVDVLAVGPFPLGQPLGLTVRSLAEAPSGSGVHTLAIQATSGSNVASRLSKVRASSAVQGLLLAGWRVEVWGWRQLAGSRRWEVRRVEIAAAEGAAALPGSDGAAVDGDHQASAGLGETD